MLLKESLICMLQGSYTDYIAVDEEVGQLVEHVQRLVKDNGEECTVGPQHLTLYGWHLTLYEQYDDTAIYYILLTLQEYINPGGSV